MTDKELLEKAARRFRDIAEDANRITTGNLTHNLPCLRGFALRAAESIERHLQEPVSKELEEASKEWLATQLDKSYAAYGETKQMELTHFDGYAMLDAIEFGAKWQKDHMMKDAVDGTMGFVSVHLKKPNFGEKFKEGVKVKILVINEG